jgi:SAM-dependent methyltransferase
LKAPRRSAIGRLRSVVGLSLFRFRYSSGRTVDRALGAAGVRWAGRLPGFPEVPLRGAARHWSRIVMDREVDAFLGSLGPTSLTAVEISGEAHRDRQPWRSYLTLDYPAFDLCAPPEPLPGRFDVVVCEQVLEHVPDPVRAVQTLHDLCRPGGTAVVSTPFLIKVHPYPGDYWRFTEEGLRLLLTHVGFRVDRTGSWGNAAAVRANFVTWARHRPWRSLRNDPELPVSVWAFAHRST